MGGLRLACSGPGRQGVDSCTNLGFVSRLRNSWGLRLGAALNSGSPETGVGGLRPVGSADKGGAAEERRLGTEVDSRLSTARRGGWVRLRRGGWVRCRGGDSCGPTGVSTRCARPPHALRPCRVTRRPSLRSESNYGPCGPGWTGASRPSTASRRMRDEQSTGGLGRARSRGAVEAANAGAFGLRRHRELTCTSACTPTARARRGASRSP